MLGQQAVESGKPDAKTVTKEVRFEECSVCKVTGAVTDRTKSWLTSGTEPVESCKGAIKYRHKYVLQKKLYSYLCQTYYLLEMKQEGTSFMKAR